MLRDDTRRIRGPGRGGAPIAAYEAASAPYDCRRAAERGRIEGERGSPAPRTPFRDPRSSA